MFKILVFLFVSFNLHAEITELAPGLTVDTEKFTAKLVECGGVETPGTICQVQCYEIDNTLTSNYYGCYLRAEGIFNELIPGTTPPLYTGNTLSAIDYRYVVVYPYQKVTACFNYGKEVVENSLWVLASGSIISNGTCEGGQAPIPPAVKETTF